jgi:hypothetical protein
MHVALRIVRFSSLVITLIIVYLLLFFSKFQSCVVNGVFIVLRPSVDYYTILRLFDLSVGYREKCMFLAPELFRVNRP